MKVLILKTFIFLLNVIYSFFKLLKSQKKVVMISRQSNEVNDDFKLLGEELLKKGVKVVYLCRTLDGGVNSTVFTKISYGFHLFTQMYHLATSKVCVLDSYCLTVSVLKHKKDLKVAQLWHTVGKLKKFGWQIIGKGEGSSPLVATTMKMHANYDVIYYAGEAYKEVFMEGFNAPADKFRKFTLPRIDLLNDEDYINKTRKEIFSKYPQLQEKINVIYAPTFRKNENEFLKAFNSLLEEFDFEKYNLVVNLHPLTKVRVEDRRVIVNTGFSTFQMLTCADKMISDYSCVIYEAGVKNIPVYFYNYDMGNYENERGLAIDYDALPGFKAKNAKDLVKSFENDYDYGYLKTFIGSHIENTEECAKKMAEDICAFIVGKSE